jgi:hypothetical protein
MPKSASEPAMRVRAPHPIAVALLATLAAATASAQSLSVQSIGSGPALGNVTSASSGTTVFQVAASSGFVTRISGAGYRVGGGSSRPLVTLACGSDASCATDSVIVTITNIGSPTGRIGALTNFTIDALTAQITDGPSGTNPVTFTIAPIGANGTATFYVGADIPIAGNESGGATGLASSAFQVSVRFSSSGSPGTAMGTATATIFRPIALSATAGLTFGNIVRPASGTGTVAVDTTTGERTLTGDGVIGIGGAPHRATFSVTGEGGQIFSVTVPPSFLMTGPGSPITVTLTTTASGPQSLDGSLGSAGTASFGVGGSFTLPANTATGGYTGSFQVSVDYE